MLHAIPTPAKHGAPTPQRQLLADAREVEGLPAALTKLQSWSDDWLARATEGIRPGASPTDRSLVAIPDVGPACEVLLADQLLRDLSPDEREGLLAWIRGQQDPSGAWLDLQGRPDLSLTAMAYWARAQGGDERTSESMVKAVRVVHALGGAQRANFIARLWLAMAGQIEWSWLPAIPAELFLVPNSIAISPARFSPWARGVLTPYLVLAREKARLHLTDASELLVRHRGQALVAPRLTRATLAGDLLQAFDRAVKLSRKLPRGPLPEIAVRRAARWIDEAQQEHGGWFSVRPTLLSLVALRVLGARSDDPRIRRGLDYLRRARGRVVIPRGVGAGREALAQGLGGTPMAVVVELIGTRPGGDATAWLVRHQLQDVGPWQARTDAPAGGWPLEAGARMHLDLAATCNALSALGRLSADDPSAAPAWAAIRRATAVVLAMQEPDGSFARFERGETDVFMRRFPWTDADLLAYGDQADATHVRLTASALVELARTGFAADDDRVARGLACLERELDTHPGLDFVTLCTLARCAGALLPEEHRMRQQVEKRIRSRQREDGSFGDLLDTASGLRALLELGHVCVQAHRAARYLVAASAAGPERFAQGPARSPGGFGLSPETLDLSAATREALASLLIYAERQARVTELRA